MDLPNVITHMLLLIRNVSILICRLLGLRLQIRDPAEIHGNHGELDLESIDLGIPHRVENTQCLGKLASKESEISIFTFETKSKIYSNMYFNEINLFFFFSFLLCFYYFLN